MGRHSAPETDEEDFEPTTQRLPSPPPTWTRPLPLVQPSASAEAETSEAATAVTAPAAPGKSAPAPPAPAPAAGTRGDLQLLRSDTRLLLWCAGAVVVLLLVYTSVLIVLGRTDVYLIWLWVPTVLSGITIGGLLDRAHRAVASPDRSAP
jgi:hypothetical protein